MTLPKISVVTVSYNQGEFIRKNIESVLSQNYPNFEHIIVDGGSTDSTISILKEYNHLKWTSEPDRGQSHALNKGFSRASGDIIAWLNSDDWYADNIFFEVAERLKEYPVVMGMAEQTNREGVTTEVIKNVPRTYHDLWRYWVPYAWLAQLAVFFTKSVLEEVKRPDGSYIDEDLYFTMDYDLWMRIANRYPFTRHINRTLAYFRIYQENKTGEWPLATQRECSRVFRRYANRGQAGEQALSIVIPAKNSSDELKKTIISLVSQTHNDFEIVICGYSGDRQLNKELRDFTFKLSELVGHITIRFIKSEEPSLMSALFHGCFASCSPLVCYLLPRDSLAQDFVLGAINEFSRDVVGALLINKPGINLENIFYPEADKLNVAAPLVMPSAFPHVVARRHALLEFDSFRDFTRPLHALKSTLLQMIFKNWVIVSSEKFSLIEVGLDPFATLSWSEQDSILLLKEFKAECARDSFLEVSKVIRDPGILFTLFR